MNYVEPIRDTEVIQRIASNLKQQSERDYMMFCFGIYTGLRISDILKGRWRQTDGKRNNLSGVCKKRREKRNQE